MRLRLHDALVTPSYYARHDLSVAWEEHPLLSHRTVKEVQTSATVEIRNTADVVTCRFFGTVEYTTECDRCLREVRSSFSFDYTKDAVKRSDAEDFEGILLGPDESFDAEEELITAIILAFPAKHLCKEDCKGLCPVCGCDLNERQCGCDTKSWDPRLEALRNLKI